MPRTAAAAIEPSMPEAVAAPEEAAVLPATGELRETIREQGAVRDQHDSNHRIGVILAFRHRG